MISASLGLIAQIADSVSRAHDVDNAGAWARSSRSSASRSSADAERPERRYHTSVGTIIKGLRAHFEREGGSDQCHLWTGPII